MKGNNSKEQQRLTILSRRDFLKIIGISSGTAFLAACGVSPTQSTVVLTYWTPGGSESWCPVAMTESMKAFTKANPNITLATKISRRLCWHALLQVTLQMQQPCILPLLP
jgi:hypothetical protein